MRHDAPPPQAEPVQETTLSVTLGGRVLVTGVPVSSGRLAVQVDQSVPERVSLIVPWEHEGAVLDDTVPGSVLGKDGHRIEIATILRAGSRTWRLPMGTYLVTEVEPDGAGVQVTAAGLLTHVHEHENASPRRVPGVSPAVGELMALLRADGLEPVVHPGVPGVSVPAEFEIGEDRGAAMEALAAAIPARIRQAWDGSIGILPALNPGDLSPVLRWHDGEDGTTITPAPKSSREGLYSHIVVPWSREVTTTDADGDETTETVSGVVERHRDSGVLNVDTFGWRTRRVESDAIATHAQAQAVAVNELHRAHLRARTMEVTMAPDWRAELDDVPALTTRGETHVGRITGLDIPLTTGDGDMVATVGVPA